MKLKSEKRQRKPIKPKAVSLKRSIKQIINRTGQQNMTGTKQERYNIRNERATDLTRH